MRGKAEAQGHTASRRQSLGPDPRWSGGSSGSLAPGQELQTGPVSKQGEVPQTSRLPGGRRGRIPGRLPGGAAFDLGFRSDLYFLGLFPQPGQGGSKCSRLLETTSICPAPEWALRLRVKAEVVGLPLGPGACRDSPSACPCRYHPGL